jgi:hypothetical protein
MNQALKYVGQGVFYVAIAALIGYFANAPSYSRVPPDHALIKLSFTHGAEHRGDCRRRTAEELAKLAPNMRKPMDCPRERLPVTVELDIDGKTVYTGILPPTGLSGDGPSRTDQRFVVQAGPHRLGARLRDSVRAEGFDYVMERDVDLAAGQSLSIDFDAVSGGFKIE